MRDRHTYMRESRGSKTATFIALLLVGLGCEKGPDEAQVERISRVVADMTALSGSGLPEDSIGVRRKAVFARHETDSVEVQAWIQQMREDPALSAEVAQRVATIVDSKDTP